MSLKIGPTARSVPFDNTGVSVRSTNVQDTLQEFRANIVYDPETITTSLNGTTTLLFSNKSLQIVEGTATGHSVWLPDASTLFIGRKFDIPNQSSKAITIKDGSGASLAVLNPGDVLQATLRADTTAAGIWVLLAISQIAAGVNAYNVIQSSIFSTSSTTDTIITSLTFTPPSGTYGIWFSSDAIIGNNNKIAQCVIYKAGVAVSDTRRNQQGIGSNYKCSLQTLGIVQVNGSQALDVRVNVDGGTLDLAGRSFLLIRLGA